MTPSKEDLYIQLENIKHSDALGRSSNLSKLLEYLLEKEIQRIEHQATTQVLPKELEIAIDVFDKTVDFNSNEDASVRVHISRLRKKLEAYYASEGAQAAFRILIPIGEYRLTFIENNPTQSPASIEQQVTPQANNILRKPNTWTQKSLVVLCSLTIAIHIILLSVFPLEDAKTHNAISSNIIWADYQSPVRKNIIVLGTESDSNINHSSQQSNLISKGLTLAFKNILTLSNNFRSTPVILSSQLSAHDIKQANIIYIGHFEKMGMLQNYFKGSQYHFNVQKNQLQEKSTERVFASPTDINAQYIDYGLFAKVDGPRNNKIYIVSGFTDSALLWLSWFLTSTDQQSINTLLQSAENQTLKQNDNFELLFKINSMKGQDMGHELLSNTKIISDNIWNMP